MLAMDDSVSGDARQINFAINDDVYQGKRFDLSAIAEVVCAYEEEPLMAVACNEPAR